MYTALILIVVINTLINKAYKIDSIKKCLWKPTFKMILFCLFNIVCYVYVYNIQSHGIQLCEKHTKTGNLFFPNEFDL